VWPPVFAILFTAYMIYDDLETLTIDLLTSWHGSPSILSFPELFVLDLGVGMGQTDAQKVIRNTAY